MPLIGGRKTLRSGLVTSSGNMPGAIRRRTLGLPNPPQLRMGCGSEHRLSGRYDIPPTPHVPRIPYNNRTPRPQSHSHIRSRVPRVNHNNSEEERTARLLVEDASEVRLVDAEAARDDGEVPHGLDRRLGGESE